ncbi:unnamed protein product [Polarella glacialis]|uniref:AB hydrolase-1 domain-containing protein n=1 Tax=Polarella glacialis TaxID=89957 RepID=A0A813HF75_POLGL|nr:unnamed protein product [Polarella glacialis]
MKSLASQAVVRARIGAPLGHSALGVAARKAQCRDLATAPRPDESRPRVSWLDLRQEGGLRHRVLEWGSSGRLVLLFHANSFGAGPWAPVVGRLNVPEVHALAFDGRGHGGSDAPVGTENYRWELIGRDFARILKAVTKSQGRPPDACITHSFAGDCALMELAERPIPVGRMILLDPVLADREGAANGAQRLAAGTRRLGEKEAAGFESPTAVGASLERSLRAALVREALDPEARAAFAEFGSAADSAGRWRLSCSRESEACVYENRVALADHLEGKQIDADVQIVFAERRRAKPEDQPAAFARDWREAERVVGRSTWSQSKVHLLRGVGHFCVLEAPDVVAETIQGLLP